MCTDSLTESSHANSSPDPDMAFDKLVAKISIHFIHMETGNMEAGCQSVLEQVAAFFKAERVHIYLQDTALSTRVTAGNVAANGPHSTSADSPQNDQNDEPKLNLVHTWRASKTPPPPDITVHPLALAPTSFQNRLLRLEPILIPEANAPKIEPDSAEFMKEAGVGSYVNVPLLYQGELFGRFALESISIKRAWNAEVVTQLNILSDILVYVLQRKRSDEILLQLKKAIETTQLGITITDATGKIVFTNEAEARMHGYTVDELLGQHARIFSPPMKHKPMDKKKMERITSWRRESVNITKDGRIFPVSIASDVVMNAAGEPLGVVSCCEDISERKEAEEKLRESEERYALAVSGANDGLWDWDLKRNVIYFSPRWKSILGFDDTEIRDHIDEWFRRVHPDDFKRLQADLMGHLDGRSPHFECEHRMLHSDGNYRWVLSRGLAVRDDDGNVNRMAGSQTDITQRKLAEEQLLHDAFHDALTGLPNRFLFLDRVGLCFDRAKRRSNYLFVVMLLDFDNFKFINDSLGHFAGDRLLTDIARKLEAILRPGDTIARFGGDEFAVLLDDISSVRAAEKVIERIQSELNEPFLLNSNEIFLTVSIGIALSSSSEQSPEALLRDAETAMYRAKSSGRACYKIFDTSMHEQAKARLQLETDLRWAIERNEFQIYYQPIISLQAKQIIGFEALIRWNHPKRGLVHPSEFIPVAEETGLIVPLGEWMLKASCRQIKVWQEMGFNNLRVSVNFSAHQFQNRNLAGMVESVLKDAQLSGDVLKVEITESIAMKNIDFSISTMKALSEMGVQILIDDFGTGYSSLSYLKRFPINTLKIDRSFVHDLTINPDNAAITAAIIAMARSLNINVIAEGVETKEQLLFLKKEGCDLIQGYFFSKPIPDFLVGTYLRQNQNTDMTDTHAWLEFIESDPTNFDVVV